MYKKTKIIFFIILFFLLTFCKENDRNDGNVTAKHVLQNDRFIGKVKWSIIKKLFNEIKTNNLASIEIEQKSTTIEVYTKVKTDQKEFDKQLIGSHLLRSVQILIDSIGGSYKSKWRILNDKQKYGFSSDLEKEDTLQYVYLPYEILIELNKKNKNE